MKWLAAAIAGILILCAQIADKNAGRLFRERKFAESAILLERQVREEPQNYAAWMLLGLCRLQTGDVAKAEQSFLAAQKLQPANPAVYYSLARARFLLGRFDEAAVAAQEAERWGEASARVHELLARIARERGQFEIALNEYRMALKAEPGFSTALSGEAEVLFRLNRYPEARSAAQAALRANAGNAEAQNVLTRMDAAPTPIATGNSVVSPVRFSRRRGLDFKLEHFPAPQKHLPSTMAGGLAVFDFDNDGHVDIFFANGAELPSFRKSGPRFWNRLYRNLGNWQFEDVTERQRLAGEGFAFGAAAGDFDNDGRIDLFVPAIPKSLLYRNTGNGFEEISQRAGIGSDAWPVAGAWLDYDRDGLLDLFVVNYLDWNPGIDRYCGDREKSIRVYCHPSHYAGLSNRLYRNRGNGTFEDVSERTGIGQHMGKGMSAAILDIDSNGWPDIFVTNDTQPNFLFQNTGRGTFKESALQFGVARNDEGRASSSMGVDARDYDNDGLPDIVVTALVGENFQLFRNSGAAAFENRTYSSRLGLTAIQHSGWGVALADLNNDGWKDIFTANSHVTDNVELIRNEQYLDVNTVFLNRGGSFSEAQHIGPRAAHRGVAIADFDNDGRLDALVTVLGGNAELWQNESAAGNWLKVKLEGQAFGARVRLGTQWQDRTSASGYASSNLDLLHFGLGSMAGDLELEVTWPNGNRQRIAGVHAGQTVVVRQPARQ